MASKEQDQSAQLEPSLEPNSRVIGPKDAKEEFLKYRAWSDSWLIILIMVCIASLILVVPTIFHFAFKYSVIEWGLVFALFCSAAILATTRHIYSKYIMRGIYFACENSKCKGKIVSSNTHWVCGLCGHKNLNVHSFPVVLKCENCPNEPKAYRCHHCQEPIFFTEDRDDANISYRLGESLKAPEPKLDEDAKERHQHEKDKQKIIRETEIAVLQRKKQLTQEPVPKPTTPLGQRARNFIVDHDDSIEIEQTADQLRLAAARRYEVDKDKEKFDKELDRIRDLELKHSP